MKLIHASISVIFCISCTLLFGQNTTKPEFEVASIKAAPPLPTLMAQIASGQVRPGMTMVGVRFDCEMSLTLLIATAYRVRTFQIVGPDWLSSQRFEIHATIPEGTRKDQVPEMLRALLEDRFRLKAHLEDKEQPVYALVVSREGPKVKEALNADDSTSGSNPTKVSPSSIANGDTSKKEVFSMNTPDGQMSIKQESGSTIVTNPRTGPVRVSSGRNGSMRMEIQKMTMAAFAEWLAPLVDRPVVNKTNLKSYYQMTIEVPMEEFRNAIVNTFPSDIRPSGYAAATLPGTGRLDGITASDPAGRSIFHAVQQLGLKLDSQKASVETLIIDHIEQNPTEN
jgi:uncharacterized protein (TIGR03435 family)